MNLSELQNVINLLSILVRCTISEWLTSPPSVIEGLDTPDAIHNKMLYGKVAIMFEDIKDLELINLDIGHSATEVNKRANVTSMIFRSVFILQLK